MKKQKVNLILDKLITMTIDEVQMYPSIQAKIWGNIGMVSDLLDMVLDSFIKVRVCAHARAQPCRSATRVTSSSAMHSLVCIVRQPAV